MAKKHFDEKGNEIQITEGMEEARKAAFEQICKKAILVNLNQKQFSNMPFDVLTSKHVCELLEVKDDTMLQVRKFLFKPERVSKIRSTINDALLTLWNNSRPWDNIGFRLLPMEYYDDFNESFGKIKDEFEEAVREFITNYDKYLEESKKLLGKAYNKNDYPDKNQLPSLFQLEIHTSKFSEIDDVRLNLSGPELVEMQREITERYDDVMKDSIGTLCDLIQEPSFNRNEVYTLISTIESLNVKNDPEIELKLTEIKEQLRAAGKITDNPIKPKKDDDTESGMMLADDIEGIDDVIEEYL